MAKKQNWCWTWNNYDDSVECYVCGLQPAEICEYLTYGREEGSMCGTPHLQGFIRFKNAVRFDTVRSMLFGAHVEPMYSDIGAAIRYAQKEGNIEEFGKRPMDQKSKGEAGAAAYEEAWELAKEGKIDEILPSLRIRFLKTFEHISQRYGNNKPAKPEIELKDWQLKACSILDNPPHSRELYVFVDPVGGAGKSTFCQWIMNMYEGVEMFGAGKSSDIAHTVKKPKIALFDFSRCMADSSPWNAVEMIKNGCVFSSKYESGMKYFPKPHVFVFTNTPPESNKLSADRLVIIELSKPSASSSSWI